MANLADPDDQVVAPAYRFPMWIRASYTSARIPVGVRVNALPDNVTLASSRTAVYRKKDVDIVFYTDEHVKAKRVFYETETRVYQSDMELPGLRYDEVNSGPRRRGGDEDEWADPEDTRAIADPRHSKPEVTWVTCRQFGQTGRHHLIPNGLADMD